MGFSTQGPCVSVERFGMLAFCPLLKRITLGQHKSDNNNRMIQLTDVYCVLFSYETWAYQITISGGHCILNRSY